MKDKFDGAMSVWRVPSGTWVKVVGTENSVFNGDSILSIAQPTNQPEVAVGDIIYLKGLEELSIVCKTQNGVECILNPFIPVIEVIDSDIGKEFRSND